jgi:light-harvesting complex II chlorophyll a/b binding protein 4
LQFELDSLDQNLAKNLAGDIIGTRTEFADVKSTPFQPYSEVFGLQRFRECELIHGRWAMLATLGALSVEWLTGVTWQDAGKVYIYMCQEFFLMFFKEFDYEKLSYI